MPTPPGHHWSSAFDVARTVVGATNFVFVDVGKRYLNQFRSQPSSLSMVLAIERMPWLTRRPSYSSLGGNGAVLSTSKICSGLVEPQDIRERKVEVTWSVAGGQGVKPIDFCSTDNEWIRAAGGLCGMNTKKI